MRCFSKIWPLTCAAITGLACGFAQAEDLVIPGSGNPAFVLKALAQGFEKQFPHHHVSIPPSTGAAGALRDVTADTAVLGRIGRPLKPDESARGLVYVALGRDPVAFVAGAGVDVKGLTTAQVVDAFTGKVSNWRELGGKPGPIRAIGREVTDASRQAISRVIKPFEAITYGPGIKLVHLDPQVLELMDRFPTALGFLNRSALAECSTKINFLPIDGVAPSPQNVGVGRYPLWIEFGLIYKTGKLTPGAKAFVDYVRSSEGIRILREHGVLAASGTV
jgi:phosphate transport system substrate-binding protein